MDVYEKITRAMKEAGYERSSDQCRDKAKKNESGVQKNKRKDAHNKTGTERKKTGSFWMPWTTFWVISPLRNLLF